MSIVGSILHRKLQIDGRGMATVPTTPYSTSNDVCTSHLQPLSNQWLLKGRCGLWLSSQCHLENPKLAPVLRRKQRRHCPPPSIIVSFVPLSTTVMDGASPHTSSFATHPPDRIHFNGNVNVKYIFCVQCIIFWTLHLLVGGRETERERD